MIMLIGIIGLSLIALNYGNIPNHKVIATSTSNETSTITTNQSRSNTSSYTTSDSNTKEFTLVAKETTLDISPSKKIKAWTYNGSIPGPTLRVTEGDKVIVHFKNELDLPH